MQQRHRLGWEPQAFENEHQKSIFRMFSVHLDGSRCQTISQESSGSKSNCFRSLFSSFAYFFMMCSTSALSWLKKTQRSSSHNFPSTIGASSSSPSAKRWTPSSMSLPKPSASLRSRYTFLPLCVTAFNSFTHSVSFFLSSWTYAECQANRGRKV